MGHVTHGEGDEADCNDAGHYFGCGEICDEIDHNCDGSADAGLEFRSFYIDSDGGGVGAESEQTTVRADAIGDSSRWPRANSTAMTTTTLPILELRSIAARFSTCGTRWTWLRDGVSLAWRG